MNASKSSTDPVNCVKAAKLERDECRGSVNAIQGSVNATQGLVIAIRDPVNTTQAPVNAIRKPVNITQGLVNATQTLDEYRLWPTTAAAPHNKPGAHINLSCIIDLIFFIPPSAIHCNE